MAQQMTDIQFNRKNRINCFLPSARRNVGAAQKLSKLSLIKQKKGKLTTSHRYNLLPLLRSGPGGVQRELVV